MAFTSLDIPNFRALRNLRVEELRRVNLLVGRNNSGKTSLLEAVELLCAMPDVQLLFNQLKDQRPTSLNDIRPVGMLFPDDEASEPVALGCTRIDFCSDQQAKLVCLNVRFQLDTTQGHAYYPPIPEILGVGERIPQQQYAEVWTYSGEFVINEGSHFKLNIHEYGPLGDKKYMDIRAYSTHSSGLGIDQIGLKPVSSCFIQVNQHFGQYQYLIEKVFKEKKGKKILEYLSKIDPKITDIQILPSGSLNVDAGFSKLIPLAAVGEGTNRIVRLLIFLYSLRRGGVCLIDEIDTGLHYTALPVMWRAVLQAAEDNDVQLFVTTHSEECIEALVEVLRERETPLEEADCALYRLEQEEDGTKAYRYDMIAMEYLNQADLEVR